MNPIFLFIVFLCAVGAQISEIYDCQYFSVSPILRYQIKHYDQRKHYYVMREKVRRLAISHGLHEITIRHCIIYKYGVHL
jgi:hypothetical protein